MTVEPVAEAAKVDSAFHPVPAARNPQDGPDFIALLTDTEESVAGVEKSVVPTDKTMDNSNHQETNNNMENPSSSSATADGGGMEITHHSGASVSETSDLTDSCATMEPVAENDNDNNDPTASTNSPRWNDANRKTNEITPTKPTPTNDHQQKMAPSTKATPKMPPNRYNDAAQRLTRVRRGSRVIEVSLPSDFSVAGEEQPSLSWPNAIPLPPRRKRQFQKQQSLILPINIKDPKRPVLLRYEHLEKATPAAERYEHNPKRFCSSRSGGKEGAGVTFRHVLFADTGSPLIPHNHNNSYYSDSEEEDDDDDDDDDDDNSSTFLSNHSNHHHHLHHNNNHANHQTSHNEQSDNRPHLKEWYPHDPYESILNPTEQELAWLFEECRHCFGGPQQRQQEHQQQEDAVQWDFIWEYASPALKVELRSFEDNDNQTKWHSLVRWKEPLVAARMQVVQQHIAKLLSGGFRRLQMKRVIAILRLKKPCDDVGRRVYPIPDFAAAVNEEYQYSNNQSSNSNDEGRNEDDSSVVC